MRYTMTFCRSLFLFAVLALSFLARAQLTPQESPDYRLGVGDQIRVQVFQNPELTIEARVSESGAFRFPLIGTVQVGGLSLEAAENKIAEALKAGNYLVRPQVNITILQVRANLVSVLGQVNRPGRYPLDVAGMRVTDVLATAGGATANGDDVVVLTGVRSGAAYRQTIDVDALFRPDVTDTVNIPVQGGDTLYVRRAPMFYIYGEAQHSGAHRIERGMTVMQGLATGGGPTARGTESRLRLHRRNAAGQVVQQAPDMTDLLQEGDVLYVRESLF